MKEPHEVTEEEKLAKEQLKLKLSSNEINFLVYSRELKQLDRINKEMEMNARLKQRQKAYNLAPEEDESN